MNLLSKEKRGHILPMLGEGNEINAARITGVSRNTFSSFGQMLAKHVPSISKEKA